jgi:hypothetical protein
VILFLSENHYIAITTLVLPRIKFKAVLLCSKLLNLCMAASSSVKWGNSASLIRFCKE